MLRFSVFFFLFFFHRSPSSGNGPLCDVLFYRAAVVIVDIGGFERRSIDSHALRDGNYDIRAPIDRRASSRSLARSPMARAEKKKGEIKITPMVPRERVAN